MKNRIFVLGCLIILLVQAPSLPALQLATTRVASGLSLPLYVTSPPGDYQRLFIVEQVSAKIKILKNGVVLPTPFLNLDPRVGNGGGEQGLLGMAFHPNYAQNGYFYVNYTDNSGNTVIARYQVTSNPDSAAYNSEFIILQIAQPYANHNGGNLQFGPDGYLWIGTGDGGSAYDPGNRAQNGMQLLGKMLRIDVNSGNPYGVPPSNPFVSTPGMLPEIWAIGLRNPWRYSFDRLNGNLYIVDVGQNQWEEIDFQLAGIGGQNYGWRVYEGNHATGYTGLSTIVPTVTFPIYEYSITGDNCSVTGGYVYRGNAIGQLQGTYFFADYCSDLIWSFRYDGSTLTEFQNRTAELAPGGGLSILSISSFGEDAAGELYICDLNGGEVFKIVSAIEINMIPHHAPITIPANGGSFTYDVNVKNYEIAAGTFDVWIDMVYPDSTVSSALIVRTNVPIAANGIIQRPNLVQNIPASSPAGIYTFRGHTGQYPSQTWSLSTFTFEKLATGNLRFDAGNALTNSGTGGAGEEEFIIHNSSFIISSASPNPFNPTTVLRYELPTASRAKLQVFDVAGKLVAELVNGWREAGAHEVTLDGSGLPSGIYFYRIQAGRYAASGKMLLLK